MQRKWHHFVQRNHYNFFTSKSFAFYLKIEFTGVHCTHKLIKHMYAPWTVNSQSSKRIMFVGWRCVTKWSNTLQYVHLQTLHIRARELPANITTYVGYVGHINFNALSINTHLLRTRNCVSESSVIRRSGKMYTLIIIQLILCVFDEGALAHKTIKHTYAQEWFLKCFC